MSIARTRWALAALALWPSTALAQTYYHYRGPGEWGWGWGATVSYLVAWAAMTVASALLALALLWLVPLGARESVYQTARREPGMSFGAGLLLAVGLPILGLALVLTIVGSPLGIAVWIASILLAFVGFVAAAWIFGRAMAARSKPGSRMSPTAWLFAALAILCALSLIPGIGGLVWIAASVFGAGAAAVTLYRGRRAQIERGRDRRPPEPPPDVGAPYPEEPVPA